MVLSSIVEGENSFHRFVENLPGIAYRVLIQDEYKIIFFNEMFQIITGYNPEDWKGGKVWNFFQLIIPEDKLNAISTVKDAIENNVPFEVEYRIKIRSGELRWFFDRGRPIRGDNGNPSYIEGIILDITNQKEAEKRLHDKLIERNKELECLYNLSKILEDKKITKEKILTRAVNLLPSAWQFPDVTCAKIQIGNNKCETANFMKTKWNQSSEIFISDKKVGFVEVSYLEEMPSFDEGPFLKEERNLIEEIAERLGRSFERLNAEFILEESEKKYRLITENVNDLISVVNQNMIYEFVNEKAYLNIMGRSKEEMIGKYALSWVHPEDAEKSIEAFKNGFEKGEGSVEARFKDKKGIYHWFEVKGKTFTDQNGKKKALMISRDTTQHKKAKQKIIQEREKANLYLNAVEVILVALDRDGKITLINKKGQELLGYGEGELIGKNWFEVCLPPNDRERVYEYFKKLMAGEIELIKFYENPIWVKKGEERLISWSTVLFRDEYGNVTGLLSSGEDITKRKKAEKKLEESEKKYRTLIENAQEGIWTIDENSITSFVNPRMAEMLGYAQDEMLGKHLYDFMEEKSVAIANRNLERGMQGIEEQHEFEFLRKNGTKIYTLLETSPLMNEEGNYKGAVAFVSDITERKKAEKKLKESEVRYRHLSNELEVILDHLPGIVVYKDTENKILRVNKFLADAHNLKKADMENRSSFDFYPRDIAQAYWEDDLEVINSKLPKINIVEPWETDAGTRWVNTSKIPFIDENGNGKGIIAIAFDITERMLAEQKLKESEEKFRTITEQSFMGIIIIQDGLFKYFNQRAVDVSGYSLEEIQNWKEYEYLKVIHPEDLDFVKGQARKELDGKIDVLNRYAYRIIRKSGEIAWMDNYSKTIEYKGKFAALIMTEDITDKIIAEQKLKESEEKYREQNVFLNNILESLTHPFYVINADDYTVALANFTASSEGLELGEHCYSLTHNKNKPCEAPCKCPLDEVKRTKNSCLVEHTHSDSKGNEKIYEIYGYPILDESGNVVQMIEYALNITDRKIAQQELKESEKNYRDLFENSPISLWEQDYSEIKYYIDNLKNSGINDLRTFFDENPEEVKKCVSMVKMININQETIRLFKANTKEDFFAGLDIVFTEESFDTFKEQIITFAGGKKRFESEGVNYALNGDKLSIFIVCEIVAGFKEDWSKILISIVDISERKK